MTEDNRPLDPGLKKCRPDNLDEAPPGDPLPTYPSPNPQYAYNRESPSGSHKVLIMAQDGHHGPDRWNLNENDPGTTENPQHEHDDWKRNPPTILQDADPAKLRQGFFADNHVPDARLVFEVPGDKLGLSPEERARKISVPRRLTRQ